MSTQSAERRPRMTRGARRDQLLDAAADLVVTQGIDAVTMERLGAHAGVSKALPYSYFDNSDDVIVALFDREMAELDRRVGERMKDAGSFEDRVRATLRAMFDVVAERGWLVGALLAGGGGQGPLAERQREHQRGTQEWLGAFVQEEFGFPRALALNVASMCLAAASDTISLWVHRRGSRRDLTETFVTLVMGGLRTLAGTDRN